MKFTIVTAKMNSILSKVQKGVGNNKIQPITEYLKINLTAGTLTVTATSMVNFITYIEREVEGEDGEAIVKADQLIKLVAKTTKPNLSFNLKETHLEVKGNGTYKIPLFETNEFPSYTFNRSEVPSYEVETAALKKAFAVNSASLADDMLLPCLTGYNVGSQMISTDGIKMCINEFGFSLQPALVTQTVADLIANLNAEKTTIMKDGNKLLFVTDNIVIFGTELAGIEEYPDITPVLDYTYDHHAVVKREELISALDRLSLFVDKINNNGVKLTFQEEALLITDLKENSSEPVAYLSEGEESVEVGSGEVIVNIDYLKQLLSVLTKPVVQMYYSEGIPLKITEDNVTQILSQIEVSAE